MVTEPPPFPDVAPIKKGIGKLTLEVWKSFVWAAKWLHENVVSLEDVMHKAELQGVSRRPWFLAKIEGATLVADNKYKYAWTKVTMDAWGEGTPYAFSDDDSLTSSGSNGGGEYTHYAINLLESANTNLKTSTGTDESEETFPDTLHMQAIGGGYTAEVDEAVTLYVEPVVQMFIYRDEDYVPRYFFSAANSYDGGCEEPDP